jgi:pyruvate formate lyase activating enzyme
MGEGERGYCGLRMNKEGRLVESSPKKTALVHAYLDLLPTNCCAAWFCKGSKESGYNLAVFFYGCSFDCMYCQNSSHKFVDGAPQMTEEELTKRALESRVRCICFFGGSPEPHLPFALHVAEKIYEKSEGKKRICWEWNGSGNPDLVKKALPPQSARRPVWGGQQPYTEKFY